MKQDYKCSFSYPNGKFSFSFGVLFNSTVKKYIFTYESFASYAMQIIDGLKMLTLEKSIFTTNISADLLRSYQVHILKTMHNIFDGDRKQIKIFSGIDLLRNIKIELPKLRYLAQKTRRQLSKNKSKFLDKNIMIENLKLLNSLGSIRERNIHMVKSFCEITLNVEITDFSKLMNHLESHKRQISYIDYGALFVSIYERYLDILKSKNLKHDVNVDKHKETFLDAFGKKQFSAIDKPTNVVIDDKILCDVFKTTEMTKENLINVDHVYLLSDYTKQILNHPGSHHLTTHTFEAMINNICFELQSTEKYICNVLQSSNLFREGKIGLDNKNEISNLNRLANNNDVVKNILKVLLSRNTMFGMMINQLDAFFDGKIIKADISDNTSRLERNTIHDVAKYLKDIVFLSHDLINHLHVSKNSKSMYRNIRKLCRIENQTMSTIKSTIRKTSYDSHKSYSRVKTSDKIIVLMQKIFLYRTTVRSVRFENNLVSISKKIKNAVMKSGIVKFLNKWPLHTVFNKIIGIQKKEKDFSINEELICNLIRSDLTEVEFINHLVNVEKNLMHKVNHMNLTFVERQHIELIFNELSVFVNKNQTKFSENTPICIFLESIKRHLQKFEHTPYDKILVAFNAFSFKAVYKMLKIDVFEEKEFEKIINALKNLENKFADKAHRKELTNMMLVNFFQFYKRWRILPDANGPKDHIIIPPNYYNGGSNDKILGTSQGKYEIGVDLNIFLDFVTWVETLIYANTAFYAGSTVEISVIHLVTQIYDWLNEFTQTEDIPDDYWRIYQFIKWIGEGIISSNKENNKLEGYLYVNKLLDDLVAYYENHHGIRIVEYDPNGNYMYNREMSIIDKLKSIRHRVIKNMEGAK